MTILTGSSDRRRSVDAHRVIVAQALRAAVYGLGSVLLGATLASLGFSTTEAGLLLGAVVAGTVVASVAVGRWSDRWDGAVLTSPSTSRWL